MHNDTLLLQCCIYDVTTHAGGRTLTVDVRVVVAALAVPRLHACALAVGAIAVIAAVVEQIEEVAVVVQVTDVEQVK